MPDIVDGDAKHMDSSRKPAVTQQWRPGRFIQSLRQELIAVLGSLDTLETWTGPGLQRPHTPTAPTTKPEHHRK